MAAACHKPASPVTSGCRERGAALLMAMLTVALVATLASAALWQQWRSVEIEAHERDRVQAGWILIGALDWARLILREDGRSGGPDHLAEPWSIALREARLSTFLAMDPSAADLGDKAFLSGQIVDAQSRFNLSNLLVGNRVSESDKQSFVRLFETLGVDRAELDVLVENLLLAAGGAQAGSESQPVPMMPRRFAQLQWLGLSGEALRKLEPYLTILPSRTPLNLNTASAEAISARIPWMELSDARSMVSARARNPFRNLTDAVRSVPEPNAQLLPNEVSVASRFFEVHGRLRLEDTEVIEHSLVQRNGMTVTVVWRERTAALP